MESWKGNRTPSNPQEGYYVGLMNACGYRTKDLEKPVIGIVNSFTDVNPGHRAFKELVGYVKEGVWAAGGTPAEFNVPAPCDGMAQGEGMHFILPSRDLIAGSIQAMASAHGFDGLVFLCSCDKIVPGMLMAAAALNKPCMFLTAGSMLPYEADEGTYVTPDLKESIGQRNIDAISEETFTRFRENICFSCGTCSMYGTANTMGVFAEVIGLCPIDSTTMLFCSSAKYKQARDVGERIVTLTKEGVRFSDIVTEASLKNGLRHVAATGGSTNAQLHICALARVMGIPMDLAAFDAIQRDVPCVAKFKPSSKFNMYDYYKAGGVGATMKAIERYLDPDARLATGGTVGEFLARFRRRVDPEIIHTADEPLYPDGCFAVLHGNLAPGRLHREKERRGARDVPPPRPCGLLRLRGRAARGHDGEVRQARRCAGHPLRRPQGRAGDARDVHSRGDARRHGPAHELRHGHRRALLRRDARPLHRPRLARGVGRRPHRRGARR